MQLKNQRSIDDASASASEEGFAQSVLDQVAETMHAAAYPVKQLGDRELLVDVRAEISNYPIYIFWWPEQNSFMQTAMIDLVVEKEHSEIYKLLALINSELLYGHFDIDPEHGTLMFRNTQIVPPDTKFAKELVDTFIDEAVDQCEKYYAALLLVLRDRLSAREALTRGSTDIDGLA